MAARRSPVTAVRPSGAQADSVSSGRTCWRMTAITRSVMTARNTGAATYAATDRQLAGFAAATFIPAEALAQITIRNRTLDDGLPARASPMRSADKMTMPASSIAASISDAPLTPFWARMNWYWASKLTYISPAPSSASSQVANAITRLPGTRPDPVGRRVLATACTQSHLRQWEASAARTRLAPAGRPRFGCARSGSPKCGTGRTTGRSPPPYTLPPRRPGSPGHAPAARHAPSQTAARGVPARSARPRSRAAGQASISTEPARDRS